MVFLILFFTLCSVAEISASKKEQVCYDEIGCFDLKPPWSSVRRPLPVPRSPEKVKVEFYMTTRNTLEKSIHAWKIDTKKFYEPSLESLHKLDYQNDRIRTVVLISGLYHSKKGNWNLMIRMAKAYLLKEDVNIIFLHYDASIWNCCLRLVADIRIVGAIAARFLEQLMELTHLRANQIHIIGFCLGAHVAGYIGKRIPNIHRITGLEPAKPFFEKADSMYRLSDSDAHHVDVLHTNTHFWGLGCRLPLGHVDFFFNGGASVQPGCRTPQRISRVLKQAFRMDFKRAFVNSYLMMASQCSHTLVTKLWIGALESTRSNYCVMWGIEKRPRTVENSSRNQNITQNQASHSDRKNKIKCVPVGLDTFKNAMSGKFYVETKRKFPYCNRNNLCHKIGGDSYPTLLEV